MHVLPIHNIYMLAHIDMHIHILADIYTYIYIVSEFMQHYVDMI